MKKKRSHTLRCGPKNTVEDAGRKRAVWIARAFMTRSRIEALDSAGARLNISSNATGSISHWMSMRSAILSPRFRSIIIISNNVALSNMILSNLKAINRTCRNTLSSTLDKYCEAVS